IYICWNHESTYNQLTKPRYSSVYSFPLNHIVTWQRKREMQSFLRSCGWSNKSFDEVLDIVNECCRSLSTKLGENSYFILEN
uniref:Mitochondrial outer membrane transport complex Sam37/metaxin N-terminal domain-containing protein n=1 Tax=Romanomermis culicivorax TaxID=13658 RepID=A0A915IXJ6_ROMCU